MGESAKKEQGQEKNSDLPEINSFGDLLSYTADLAHGIVEHFLHLRSGLDRVVRRRGSTRQ